ncbi:MAG: glycosyltransferase [Hyphomonadaceae bacterium]
MSAVDVSVIVATWKAAAFVERALSSALVTGILSVEVIAVDDASPDDTFAKLEQLAASDHRIKVARLTENSGPSAARNRAIELASGRYVAVLDADDAILPGRLASLVAHADRKRADIVVDNMTAVDEQGQQLGPDTFLKSAQFRAARPIDLLTWIAYNQPLGGGDCLGYLKPLIRRSKLIELGIRYDAGLRNSEDYYLIAHLLAAGSRMNYLPDPGYLYTRSSGSISHRLKPVHTRALLDAEARFQSDFHGRFSPKEAAALSRRMRGLRNLHQFVCAIDAVQEKKFGAFLGLLASDVRASSYTLGMFARIAAGKVMKRKLV